jgi:predicted nucleic acid-binding protein
VNKIFVDTNILLDLLAKREPFYTHAAALFSLSEKGMINLCTSPLVFSDLYYILRKLSDRENAWSALLRLRRLVSVLAVDDTVIDRALESKFTDFENAIQNYTAETGGTSYFITRNVKDFKASCLTVMTAEDFIQFSGLGRL